MDEVNFMQNIDAKRRRRYLDIIKHLRLLDDDFMTICFDGDNEFTEFVLKILLDTDDLHVIEVKTQYSIKNIHGRSVRLDVFASDSTGKKYNIEIQRTDSGATFRRARYNSSLIDGSLILPGESVENLPETYVIFITENDVIGADLPIYHIERKILETDVLCGDGTHIIYVNAQHRSETPLGRLMQDFVCTDPAQMNYGILARKASYFKDDEKGVSTMCKLLEDFKQELIEEFREEFRAEGRAEGRAELMAEIEVKSKQNALQMIRGGKLSYNEIAQYSGLPIETVHELAAQV